MANKKPVIAICYDFDGTLSPGNMQEYGFFSGLGSSAAKKCAKGRNGKYHRYKWVPSSFSDDDVVDLIK